MITRVIYLFFVKSHLSRYAHLEDICSFFACRIRVVLLERPRVLSIQFEKIISEIPNRLTPLMV